LTWLACRWGSIVIIKFSVMARERTVVTVTVIVTVTVKMCVCDEGRQEEKER